MIILHMVLLLANVVGVPTKTFSRLLRFDILYIPRKIVNWNYVPCGVSDAVLLTDSIRVATSNSSGCLHARSGATQQTDVQPIALAEPW